MQKPVLLQFYDHVLAGIQYSQLPAIYHTIQDEILLLVLLICNCTKEPKLLMILSATAIFPPLQVFMEIPTPFQNPV
ncbi:hypothetical protein SDJN02_16000, partial [Cucurbita argyrosperma subsp. argyrosperma]